MRALESSVHEMGPVLSPASLSPPINFPAISRTTMCVATDSGDLWLPCRGQTASDSAGSHLMKAVRCREPPRFSATPLSRPVAPLRVPESRNQFLESDPPGRWRSARRCVGLNYTRMNGNGKKNLIANEWMFVGTDKRRHAYAVPTCELGVWPRRILRRSQPGALERPENEQIRGRSSRHRGDGARRM